MPERPGATQADMQRHHRALREADQGGPAFVQSVLGHLLVDEGIDFRRGAAHTGQRQRGIEPRYREPLVTEGIALAGLRCVGGVEHRVGHQRAEGRRQADQVVAVGAVAVQQDHEMAGSHTALGGAVLVRAVAGAVELVHLALASTLGAFALQSGMLRR
jgi:hypothetical protein